FFSWTRSGGLARAGMGDAIYETQEPVKALRHVTAAGIGALYHFRGLARGLEGQDLLVSLVCDAARSLRASPGALVLTGDGGTLPGPVGELAAHVLLPGPSDEEFERLLV